MSDREVVSSVFTDVEFEQYRYFWHVVNTRGFYWEFPGEIPPESHEDRMVLMPWVDYFDHNDHGCNVSFDKDSCIVTSNRAYGIINILPYVIDSDLKSSRCRRRALYPIQ